MTALGAGQIGGQPRRQLTPHLQEMEKMTDLCLCHSGQFLKTLGGEIKLIFLKR